MDRTVETIRRPNAAQYVLNQTLPPIPGWRVVTYDRETHRHVVTEAARLALVRPALRPHALQQLTALEYDAARDEWFPVDERRDFCCLLQPTDESPHVDECRGQAHPERHRLVKPIPDRSSYKPYI